MGEGSSIREIAAAAARFERVGAHTHIRGLGLDDKLRAVKIKDGMVGQERAREAAGLVVRMIKEGKLSGKLIILAGPPGTGKTALAVGIARELGLNVPFIAMSASEIYSGHEKKTEILIDAMRRCIGVELKEMRTVYEGEVSRLELMTVPHPYNPYYKVPEGARITLLTTEDERTLEVGPEVAQQLMQQGISEGAVVQIDAESGRVTLLGISEKSPKAKHYEIGSRFLVPRPSGRIKKEKEFVYTLTLSDLDKAFARQRKGGGLLSLFFFEAAEAVEPDVRAEVDRQVKAWVDEGRAVIHPGVLFIDDAHMLDVEAFSFLSRALEGELMPILILATNRGMTKIRGTDIEAPMGFPLDLIDRAVIIPTYEYDADSIREIVRIRSMEEKLELTQEALAKLTEIGARSSLRYALQLLSLAGQQARSEGRSRISLQDVERVAQLFMDVGQAVEHLKKYELKLLR
ncbi:MAG: TATA box-binding protein [Nitrososphaerota archaeon]